MNQTNAPTKTVSYPAIAQLHCACHGGGKVMHYFTRIGPNGAIYTCSCCGAEKTQK